MSQLSIIIPTLNEEETIAQTLEALADLRVRGTEIIVVDGGSRDATVERAQSCVNCVISAPRGRASQMNAGAEKASGDVVLFLHADTLLPGTADALVVDGLANSGRAWGRFDVTIESRSRLLSVAARLMNIRSRLSGVATGDQAIFIRRETFCSIGGFPEIPLMEDLAISRRLKRVSRPLCLRARVVTSGRRWDRHGTLRMILLMWRLRLAYFFGADPAVLAKRYGYGTQ